MMASRVIDPYVTLGIPASASRTEVDRAHRSLAKQFHPDLNPRPAADERMRQINEAWRILSDPAARARYDAGRAAASSFAPWHASAGVFGPHQGPVTWTAWPDDRQRAASRIRRPLRRERPEPSFGDRPVVIAAITASLALLYFVGAWLGSLTP
jgi:curved DNA-binding protein CbpA